MRKRSVEPPGEPCYTAASLQRPDFDQDALVARLDVLSAIRFLSVVSEQPLWGNKTENFEAIEAIKIAVAPLREALSDATGHALVALFLAGGVTTTGVPTATSQEAALAKMRGFVGFLRRMESRCDQLMADAPGVHGNLAFRQRLAAEQAWDLLTRRDIKPTTPATGLFYKITSLLFESVDGTRYADLTRTCREVINSHKKSK